MPSVQQQAFPTMAEIMDLVRTIADDTFPSIDGTPGGGRVFTNDAPFVLPLFNGAFRWIQRKLRNEGATFPIIDNVILPALAPVVEGDPSVQTYVSFNGFFNGTTQFALPRLPSDCMQVLEVQERGTGTNLPFSPMSQPEGGLQSRFQYQRNGAWEWRNYKIWLNGATQLTDLRIRYQAGLPPLNVPAADFETTTVNILDCQDVVANSMVYIFGRGRGAADLTSVKEDRDEAMDDMANDWVRRSQSIIYRRQPYGGAESGIGSYTGQTGIQN
jgi:hypothetical protein